MSNEETAQDQQPSGSKQVELPHQGSVPTTGKRTALSGLAKQLSDSELAQPGVQKLLVAMIEEADTERDSLKSFVTAFHEADKKAATLGEKLHTDRSVEVFFGVGVGMGGTIIGLFPYFRDIGAGYALVCLVVGGVLVIGAVAGRLVKR